ncbi:MAG: peptide chain release factor N(5)-glutamine methyltransferase [Thermodesulfobacteriota bacterium]
MSSLIHLYEDVVGRLAKAGIENARQEALQLLEFCLGLGQNELLLRPGREVEAGKAAALADAVARRLRREPLQYITGSREFWSLDFTVSPDVLIPRPETEFLLDRVLAVLGRHGYHGGPVLDMCTGSGVIATILALELGPSTLVAADKSLAALRVARRNWQQHGQEARILPLCADLFSACTPKLRFELIVANPPYVADEELPALQPEVRDWEPKAALLAGARGMDVIERLAGEGHGFLQAGGWMFVEIGADQERDVYSLFAGKAEKRYERVEVLRDWSGRPRVLQARKTGD